MKTLTIQEANALRAYSGTDSKGKQLLSDLFGKEVFNQKITDRIKSFEDACSMFGYDPADYTIHEEMDGIDKAAAAFRKLAVIAQALNDGWKPDWNNSSEYKYYPYFDMRSGFSFDDVGNYYSRSNLGSRLCFKTEALAKYAGTQFLELYKQMMVLPD